MVNNEAHNVMIIAGEISGDLHGASLVSELRKINSSINICGIGGDKMKAAGMELIYHIDRMAFLGFAEVVKHIPFIKKVQKELINIVKQKNIKTIVLIDYPGFNLNIAKKLKQLGITIVYYISPQIWAWGAGRMKKIKYLVNKMLVVFPFEEKLYKDAGVAVEYVGHPLMERINEKTLLNREELYGKFNLDKTKDILLILSGSRKHEVEKIFPEVITASAKLAAEYNMQIVVACSSNINENTFYELTELKDFVVIKDHTYDLMNTARFGIIKSGTSTLEAALFELPMVIVYRTSFLTYMIGKNLVKLKSIGLANIVAGKVVVPELIQKDVNADTIYNECKKILSDKVLLNSIKEKFRSIKATLGSIGASKRAAESIYAVMNSVESRF